MRDAVNKMGQTIVFRRLPGPITRSPDRPQKTMIRPTSEARYCLGISYDLHEPFTTPVDKLDLSTELSGLKLVARERPVR